MRLSRHSPSPGDGRSCGWCGRTSCRPPTSPIGFGTSPGRRWHGTAADIDPRPGGLYRVLVGGQSQSAGQYVEVVPEEKVVFTFGWEQVVHPIPAGSTTVEIPLHPEGDKTLVRLVHRGLPDE